MSLEIARQAGGEGKVPETIWVFRHVKYTGIEGMFGWSRVYIGILVRQSVSSKRAPQLFLWHFNISCISSVSPHVNHKHVDKGVKV